MASLRLLKGKYYVRVRLKNKKERLIGTGTSDKRIAKQLLRRVQEQEFLVKAKLQEEIEIEPVTLGDAIERFLKNRLRYNRRKGTVDSYELSLNNLSGVIKPLSPVNKLCEGDLHKLVDKLSKAGLSPTTINIRLRSIKAFINWSLKNKIIKEPIQVETLREDSAMPKMLTPNEISSTYEQCKNPKLLSTFRVYEYLGIRRGELYLCKREGDFIRVGNESKGRRERLIRLPEEIKIDFEIATTDPYSLDYISKSFSKYARRAGIEKGKSLHSLRHSFAGRMWLETHDIKKVKDLLGHSDYKVTEIYTQFPDDYLKQILNSASRPDNPAQNMFN